MLQGAVLIYPLGVEKFFVLLDGGAYRVDPLVLHGGPAPGYNQQDYYYKYAPAIDFLLHTINQSTIIFGAVISYIVALTYCTKITQSHTIPIAFIEVIKHTISYCLGSFHFSLHIEKTHKV